MSNCDGSAESTMYLLHIDEESDKALSLLSTSAIQFVISEWCEVHAGKSTLTLKTAYIQVSPTQFISIETDWLFTSEPDGLRHHEMILRTVSDPGKIFYEPARSPGGFNFKGDHASVCLGAKCNVSKVDVLVATETGPAQTSIYDAGVVITREDGLRIAMVRTESIAGFMDLAHESTGIETLCKGLKIRRTYSR